MSKARQKGLCENEECVWALGHTGPHGVKCKPCGGDGIVNVLENWITCFACKGRGWENVSRKSAKEAVHAD